MIRKLTIENFFSINEAVSFDFAVAQNATDPDSRFARPILSSSARFPKAIALFGANASGKTNVLRAITFLLDFARNSAMWPPEALIPFIPFDVGKSDTSITKLTIELDGALFPNEQQRKVYTYSLSLDFVEKTVVSESLRYVPENKNRWLFRRNRSSIDSGSDFGLSKQDPVREKVRNNASVISTLAQFNHPFATAIYRGLSAVQSNVGFPGKMFFDVTSVTQRYQRDNEAFAALKRFINKFDFGITNIDLQPGKDGVEPIFFHAGLSRPISYVFESQGTQTFYKCFPILEWALRHGSVAIMDELDGDIHPLLLPEIVRLFQSKEFNPHDAQLIMSCHNPILLETLTKEEIFFTEKDNQGQTHAYGLKDIQAVRRDTNIYAKYLAGAFGAVPRVG